jgi:hypothetical protein
LRNAESLLHGGVDVRRDAAARIDPHVDDQDVVAALEGIALAQNWILD